MIPKFRAWDKLAEEMIDEIMMISFVKKEIIGKYKSGQISVPLKFEDERNGDDVILMQSTGLKDKNGKEIFEGDIVTDGHTTGDIKNHPTLGFYMVDDNGVERWFSDHATIEDFEEDAETIARILEIIGNIFENPELIK